MSTVSAHSTSHILYSINGVVSSYKYVHLLLYGKTLSEDHLQWDCIWVTNERTIYLIDITLIVIGREFKTLYLLETESNDRLYVQIHMNVGKMVPNIDGIWIYVIYEEVLKWKNRAYVWILISLPILEFRRPNEDEWDEILNIWSRDMRLEIVNDWKWWKLYFISETFELLSMSDICKKGASWSLKTSDFIDIVKWIVYLHLDILGKKSFGFEWLWNENKITISGNHLKFCWKLVLEEFWRFSMMNLGNIWFIRTTLLVNSVLKM